MKYNFFRLAILDAHRILGPVFFLTYVFFVFFVLLNMFLAIINDTYSEVKNDLSTQKSEFELGDYFKKSYERMLDRLNVKRDVNNYFLHIKILISLLQRIIDIQNALKSADVNQDGVIEVSKNLFKKKNENRGIQFDEWRRTLKARGYTDTEIENVFSRYDTDGDRILHVNEQRQFKSDLMAQENNLDMDIKGLKNDPNGARYEDILFI